MSVKTPIHVNCWNHRIIHDNSKSSKLFLNEFDITLLFEPFSKSGLPPSPGGRRVRFFLIQSGDGALPAPSPALRGESRLDQKLPPFGNRSEIPTVQGPEGRWLLCKRSFLFGDISSTLLRALCLSKDSPPKKYVLGAPLRPCGDISILDKNEVSERNPYENEMRILLK